MKEEKKREKNCCQGKKTKKTHQIWYKIISECSKCYKILSRSSISSARLFANFGQSVETFFFHLL